MRQNGQPAVTPPEASGNKELLPAMIQGLTAKN